MDLSEQEGESITELQYKIAEHIFDESKIRGLMKKQNEFAPRSQIIVSEGPRPRI